MKPPTSENIRIEVVKPELKRVLSRCETVKSADLFGSTAIGVASDFW